MSTARVIVDSRVRVLVQDVGPGVADRLRELHEHKNPAHEKMKRMGFRFDHRKEPKVIRTWRDEGPWLSLPRGGMDRTRTALSVMGFELRVRDDRTEGLDAVLERHRWAPYSRELYPHQREALAAILARETCYLRAPTGAGKTSVCTAAIAEIRRPAIVVVWTGALFDQWMDRIHEELGISKRNIGQVRGGAKKIGAVTVAMQQTLAQLPPDDLFWKFFGVVIADELQKFSAPTFIASIDSFAARYRIGVSADERRKDRKEFLAHDMFADLAISIDRRELVASGHVRDVEVRVVPTGWRREVEVLGSAGDAYREMLDAMADSEERDDHVVRIVLEERQRGEQILVFSLRTEHCRKLVGRLNREGITAGLMLGGAENREALKDAVESIRGKRMQVAVGTVQAVGTGVDLPSVGVGIAAMPFASNRQLFGQVAGRVCRSAGGEGAARLYYLLDGCRGKDWPALFDDGRPVLVLCPDGTWMDARHHRRAAKKIAVPQEETLWTP